VHAAPRSPGASHAAPAASLNDRGHDVTARGALADVAVLVATGAKVTDVSRGVHATTMAAIATSHAVMRRG
jgi:hypothetical protein